MTTIKKISKDGIVFELPRPIEIDTDKIKKDADLIPILISEWKKDQENFKKELKAWEIIKNEIISLDEIYKIKNVSIKELNEFLQIKSSGIQLPLEKWNLIKEALFDEKR